MLPLLFGESKESRVQHLCRSVHHPSTSLGLSYQGDTRVSRVKREATYRTGESRVVGYYVDTNRLTGVEDKAVSSVACHHVCHGIRTYDRSYFNFLDKRSPCTWLLFGCERTSRKSWKRRSNHPFLFEFSLNPSNNDTRIQLYRLLWCARLTRVTLTFLAIIFNNYFH